MFRSQWCRTYASLFFVCVAGLLSNSIAQAHGPGQHGVPSELPRWSKQVEIRFLEDLSDYHSTAAAMGKLARLRSSRAELRAWGDTLATRHAAELQRVDALLRLGYQRNHVPPAFKAAASLEKLKGAAFDKEFLAVMLQHQGAALAGVRECSNQSADPRLRGLCVAQVKSQQLEAATMGGWLCRWFKQCD